MNHHFFIGIDRSDQTIDFCLYDSSGTILKQSKVDSAPETLVPWINSLKEQLPPNQTIALCIEQPCQNLVNLFTQFDFLTLYLINPALIKNYRKSLSSSRAKDDRRDAQALAQFVFERHLRLAPHTTPDPLAHQIATLVEKRRQLVDIRTSLSKKLTQALKDTFPQALQLIGRDLFAPLACALLNKWPTLHSIQKARPSTITQFYYKQGSRRPKVIEQRLQLIDKAIPICTDPGQLETAQLLIHSLVTQLQQIQTSVTQFDQAIETKTTQHQDAKLFTSLPGAGPCFAARLLVFFGSDRTRYDSAACVQKHSGVAPLTKQSGKMHFVHRRYACNKFWRQTFVEWTAQTIMKSLWAKAYYQQQKDKGHRHQSILRSLAYKWQRILFRCWKNNELYDEKHYLKTLRKRSSPLVPIIATIRKTHPKLSEQFS
jgi:transposase